MTEAVGETLVSVFAICPSRLRSVHREERGPSSDDQEPFTFSDRDVNFRPGIEFKEIGLDAVAENYPALRHVRFNQKRCIARYPAKNHVGTGGLAGK
jgi:hypothetical protein